MAWAPDYASTADVKGYTRIPDTADDVQIALAVTAASRAVDRVCGRQFGLVAAPEARYYTPQWDSKICRWLVKFDDLMTTTGLVVMADLGDDGTYESEVDGYALRPVNAAPKSRPWTSLVVLSSSTTLPVRTEASVEVTAKWGWSAIPDAVKQATILQASRILKRRDAPFGVAGSPDSGSEIRLLARVDPDVAVILNSYVRWWG